MSNAIFQMAELLARLPGIGQRTALRLTFHLLKAPEEYLQKLGEEIATLRERVRPCSVCRNLSGSDPCEICRDGGRDDAVICIVESVPDLWAVENSGAFRGRYHVLHGMLSPLDGIGPRELNIDLLAERVAKQRTEELVVATRSSVEGEATAMLIRQVFEGRGIKISRIASGIPHGGELEYSDKMTLGRAFEGRREI